MFPTRKCKPLAAVDFSIAEVSRHSHGRNQAGTSVDSAPLMGLAPACDEIRVQEVEKSVEQAGA